MILCLSTVKWVHFNFGDTGLKALFLKVYEQLAPGGIFIFEQQPWKAYKKLGDKQPAVVMDTAKDSTGKDSPQKKVASSEIPPESGKKSVGAEVKLNKTQCKTGIELKPHLF